MRGAATAWLLILFWLAPMTYYGLLHKPVPFDAAPLLNRSETYKAYAIKLNYFYNISCLFLHRHGAWYNEYIEVLPGNSPDWVQLPDEDFSPMQPFGHRARIDRLITRNVQYKNRPEAPQQMREMARWIHDRYAKLYPDRPAIRAVRFSRIVFNVGGELAAPAGRWIKRPFLDYPNKQRALYYEPVYFDDSTEP